ncbi:MAG: peptidoglycan DD-metalloendopeptidase family protein [Nitrosomonas sp.]|nr:peptidoglycan DD-metalloendopeptidase family protein [Nitrosomonas sp.]
MTFSFNQLTRQASLMARFVTLQINFEVLNPMKVIFLLIVVLLSACASTPYPVVDRQAGRDGSVILPSGARELNGRRFHVVQHGDTLYGIARRYGLDVHQLKQANRITDPGQLRIGQEILLSLSTRQGSPVEEAAENEPRIYAIPYPDDQVFNTVTPGPVHASSATLKTEPRGVMLPYSDAARDQLSTSSREGSSYEKVAVSSPGISDKTTGKPVSSRSIGGIDWTWPTEGRVKDAFSGKSRGVGIAGSVNQPVHASASGTVVYSGNGLRGYGNLVIIKHDDTYLSAYGHNSRVLVNEGDRVVRGQKIAEMGHTDSGATKLHFEIRKQGKPVNPLEFLPAR